MAYFLPAKGGSKWPTWPPLWIHYWVELASDVNVQEQEEEITLKVYLHGDLCVCICPSRMKIQIEIVNFILWSRNGEK